MMYLQIVMGYKNYYFQSNIDIFIMSKDKQIQLKQIKHVVIDDKSLKQTLVQEQTNKEEIKTIVPRKRKQHNLYIYILVCILELVTIFLGLLLLIVPSDHIKYVYLSFIIMTCFRAIVFFGSSYQLIGLCKQMFLLYFCFDNVLLMMIASDITYIFLNILKEVENVKGALVCYPFLTFFLCGNSRVMLQYALWQRWQVLVYKSIKLIGSTYYLTYGCYITLSDNYNQNQSDLFLLWIFTTCAFWGEMCFQINTKDGSDNMKTDYILADDDDDDEDDKKQ